jgi:omega-6 fatty acid desaturase (delta-12 desaturase)
MNEVFQETGRTPPGSLAGANPEVRRERTALQRTAAQHEGAILRRSLWQMATSFLPFLAICAVMYWSVSVSWLLTLALSVLAAGFVVRIFIIQHDCGHGSFFRSRRANLAVGTICSLFTLTPYLMWRRQHAGHHANWNNLDRRLSGVDIYSGCLTVAEYGELSPIRRWGYRMLQHPLVSWVLLPPAIFFVLYRLPFDSPRSWRQERRTVQLTNLALLGVVLALGFTFGFRSVALVQVPIAAIAAITGVWLFSVQHRFEGTLWARQDVWHPVPAALEGSSYLKLPAILKWFTGNIGFHHIHHLNSGIPNYRLEACHQADVRFQTVSVMTVWQGLSAWRSGLWDERIGRMVPFVRRSIS